MTREPKDCVVKKVNGERLVLVDHQVNQEGMVSMVLRETKDRVGEQEILVKPAWLEILAQEDHLDQREQRVFLVKGVLKVLLEFSEPKGTWASKVNQAHGEPGVSQDRMVCADNVANQAVLALTVWLALRASKENRVQLVLWEKLAA